MDGVRIASEDDAAAIADVYAPYVRDTVISFEVAAPSEDDWRGRIRKTLPTHPFLVFEAQDGVCGYAYGSPHRERAAYRWSVDVGIYIAAQSHGRGVGRALYGRLLDILRRQGFHAAYAGITLPNDKSVGLHEAMGFAPVGVYREVGFKLGAWRDVGWWARALAPGAPQGEPIPFADLHEET